MNPERGQVTILVLGLSLVAFAITGLALDGTRAFLYRRTLQNAADGASLAGAGELDRTSYYSSGGRVVKLDPGQAQRAAHRWLALRGLSAHAAVGADDEQVAVVLRGRIATMFLGLVGISSIPVAVEAASEPIVGRPRGP